MFPLPYLAVVWADPRCARRRVRVACAGTSAKSPHGTKSGPPRRARAAPTSPPRAAARARRTAPARHSAAPSRTATGTRGEILPNNHSSRVILAAAFEVV